MFQNKLFIEKNNLHIKDYSEIYDILLPPYCYREEIDFCSGIKIKEFFSYELFLENFSCLLILSISAFLFSQQNQTPLDLAVAKQNMSLIRLLRKHFGFTAPPSYQNEEISNGNQGSGGAAAGMTLPFSDSTTKLETPPEEEYTLRGRLVPKHQPEMPPKNNIRRGSDQIR